MQTASIRLQRFLVILGVFLAGFLLPYCGSSKSTTTTAKPVEKKAAVTGVASLAPALEDDILRLINQHRTGRGLPALQSSPAIEVEARKHSLNMARHRVPFGHDGLNIRMKTITMKISSVNEVGENVAFGSRSAKEVVDGWLNSAGHRKNIEGNFRLTGIGVARDQKGQLYFTQIFAR